MGTSQDRLQNMSSLSSSPRLSEGQGQTDWSLARQVVAISSTHADPQISLSHGD